MQSGLRLGRGSFSGFLLVSLAAFAGCGEAQPDSSASNTKLTAIVGNYDPNDGVHPMLIDLVVPDAADLGILEALEIQVTEKLHTDDLGRRVVTIRATGMLAANLSEYGFVAEGHRVLVPSHDSAQIGRVVQATVTQCGPWPESACMFPWYDPSGVACAGGIQQELSAMHNPPLVTTKTIGTTLEKRPLLAVRLSGRQQTEAPVPTVYILGTHHAREWATTEVTLRLLRDFRACALSGAAPCFDPEVNKLLADRAIVFVPVSNPDGYQFSRSPTGFRDQRKNRHAIGGCSGSSIGVDINRNYSTAWGLSGCDFCSSNSCNDTYIGPGAASEPETMAIQNLLQGSAFVSKGVGLQAPAATISYHTYADVVIYPDGWKGDALDGPACAQTSNCLNPDFSALRRLFGDTEKPFFFDNTLAPKFAYPSGPGNNVLYTVTGDVTAFANYNGTPSSTRSLAITPELTSKTVGFYTECEADPESIISALVKDQRALLKRLLQAAPGLVSTTPATGFASTELGVLPPGMWAREFTNGRNTETARATWTKSRWLPSDSPAPFTATVNGTTFPMEPGRKGDQYHLYQLPVEKMTEDPLCIPCSIVPGGKEGPQRGSDGAPKCEEKCINLCDPDRLPASGWKLIDGARGGAHDCWWEPADNASSDAVLEIPDYINPNWNGTPPTHCHLFFSYEWSSSSAGQVLLERLDGAWTETSRWPFGAGSHPANEWRSSLRVRSEAIETNTALPGKTHRFRFRVPSGGALPKFKLFDPVVYCRYGSLP